MTYRLAVAAPCMVLVVLSAWWSLGLPIGRGLWPVDDVTLPEAVATRNNAEALRLIGRGADPNRAGPVRDGLLTNGYAVSVLPIEAAVAAQRADSLRMLLANGAAVDDQELRMLRCLERVRRDSGVREILEGRATGEPNCDDIHLPIDRTR